MRIAINGNRHQEGHFEEIDRLITTLMKRGDDIVMAEPFIDYLSAHLGRRFATGIDYLPLSTPPTADIAVSIGGDGAFLKTARWVGARETPVAGINTGNLGYLSAFTFERSEEIYNLLLNGHYRVEHRSLLSALITESGNEGSRRQLIALNELAITRGDHAAMLNISAIIDSSSSLDYVGDGLIISTPTGSTAYNLSVGGPILDPELAGWVLSPIAAHSLSMRPLVVKDNSVIDIRVNTRANSYRLAADGKSVTLPLNARLQITRAPYAVNLILQPDHTFTDTLREKLGMGTNLRKKDNRNGDR